jgi:hypothetical protein
MVQIKIDSFGGEIPAIDNRLLPGNQAAASVNAWLYSGRVEPVHSLVPLRTTTPTTRSWFRLPKGNPGIGNMIDSDWLEFQNQNVRVIRSPVAGQDDDGRFYWADGVYPKMMTGDMIRAHATPLKLGVPSPQTAPGVTSSGGTSTDNKTVAYVYTWVSALGEEGPPSPPTEHVGKEDATYHITMTAPTGLETANRNLTKTRIYRTVVGAQGLASYFFVTELPIATLTYDDSQTDADVTNNEQLATLYWQPPPADLQGLVSMPNGMVAGWRKNEVWFCEPYYPHAWPVTYTIAVPNDIVGLGVFNQSLIILTQGQPYAATGVDPASMALAMIQPLEPCTSRNSIVSTPNGVLYSSPNGLINITPAGAMNITAQSIQKDQWDKLLYLNSIAASILATGYYAYSIQVAGVFQSDAFQNNAFQQSSAYGTLPGIYQKLDDPRIGLTILDPTPVETQNVITDIFNGETTIMRDGVIYVVDIRKHENYGKYRWRSKIYTLDYVQNLGAAKVYWIKDPDPAMRSVFRVYAGAYSDVEAGGLPLRFEQEMTEPGQPFRLPSGYKALYYQFEVEGYAPILGIHVASSPRELRGI